MTSIRSGPDDGRTEIVSAWRERCRASGASDENCAGPEAFFLLSALRLALRRGGRTPELGRAARSWGSRFSDPVGAVLAVSALREVIVNSVGRPEAGWSAAWLPVEAERFDLAGQQLLLEAVDAASSNLRMEARTDPLTGCANRLALHEDLERAVAGAARSGLDVSLAVVDLDGLKQINDAGGHDSGDRALQALVASLRAVMRDADTLYRSGGDEFVVIAPFTNRDGVAALLERATAGDGPRFSWGVASLSDLGADVNAHPELLVTAADTDLYARRGRDRLDRRHDRQGRGRELQRSGRDRGGRGVAALVGAAVGVDPRTRRARQLLGSAADAVRGSTRHSATAATLVAASLLLAASGAYALAGASHHRNGPGVAAGPPPGTAHLGTGTRRPPPSTTTPAAAHPSAPGSGTGTRTTTPGSSSTSLPPADHSGSSGSGTTTSSGATPNGNGGSSGSVALAPPVRPPSVGSGTIGSGSGSGTGAEEVLTTPGPAPTLPAAPGVLAPPGPSGAPGGHHGRPPVRHHRHGRPGHNTRHGKHGRGAHGHGAGTHGRAHPFRHTHARGHGAHRHATHDHGNGGGTGRLRGEKPARLVAPQSPVNALVAETQQLPVRSFLHDPPMVDDHDPVQSGDRGQPVGHHERRGVLHEAPKGVLDEYLGL